jgi:hypothetical protein
MIGNLISRAVKGGTKKPNVGKRFSDREKTQEGSKDSKAVNKENITNRNDYIPSRKADVFKDQKSDISTMMKQSSQKGGKLIEETQAKAKQRAASRTGVRAGAAAGSLGVGYGAGELINEKTKKPETKTKTVVVNKDDRANKKDYPVYKKDTPSSKAFKDAFKTAKDENKASFTFEGRKYNTKDKK